jgi:hypothetical protein
MYTSMQRLLFLLECNITFKNFGDHQVEFIPSTRLGEVLN